MSQRLLIRWPEEGIYQQHEINCILPRQSDVLRVEGTWVRVTNVLIHPHTIVHANRIATEDDEVARLESQWGLTKSEAAP